MDAVKISQNNIGRPAAVGNLLVATLDAHPDKNPPRRPGQSLE